MDKEVLITNFKQLERLLKPYWMRNLYYFKPIKGFSLDSRSIENGQAFIALRGKFQDGHKFISEAVDKGASLVVAQRGIPGNFKIPFFLVDDTYEALKQIVYYIRKKKNPYVYGITGSVGKTTTKEMLSFLLQPAAKVLKNYKTENNLLGVGKTILSLRDEEVLILELGTNSCGEIKTLGGISYPDTGIVTFIKAVHLKGLKNLKGVFEEKISFLERPGIKAILNKDDFYLRKVNFCKKVYWFGKGKECDLYARFIKRDLKNSIFLIQDKFKLILPRQFEGFIANVQAAMLGASLYGLPLGELVERMNSYEYFSCGRMETVKLGGVTFINDAYNANPYSFKQALGVIRRYPFKKIAVVGDMLELGGKSIYYHKLLAYDIIKSKFDYCLTMGDYAFHLRERLKELGYRRVFHFFSHQEIARFIHGKAKKGWLIFLKGSRKMELEKVIDLLKK